MSKIFSKNNSAIQNSSWVSTFSHRFLASLLLAVILWSGVGGVFYKTDNFVLSGILKTRELKAQSGRPITIYEGEAGAKGLTPADVQDPDRPSWWSSAVNWATGIITGPLAKTVMSVNGILLQFIAIPVTSFLFRISAAMLDMAVRFTLSTKVFSDTSSGVMIVWALIRDICNITFIFILLYTALKTIIGSANSNTKKMIANVIIAAILINFSLFITRIIIDAGNILGVSLFKNIIKNGGTLDTIITDKLGLSSILDAGKEAKVSGVWSVSFGIISYLQFFTLFIAFLVFIYATFLMIVRIVALVFLAALSPIGFMGNVLPKFSEYSKQWRETLYGQVMVAPIFLLFVYLIIQVSDAFNKVPEIKSTVALTTEEIKSGSKSTDYLGFFKYMMVITLLVIAVKTTKKMTGAIGAAVEKFGGMAVGAALGLATGGAALAMRRSVGKYSADALEKNGEDLRNRAAAGDKKARIKLAALEKGANSSFDFRNTKAAGLTGKVFGTIGGQLGIKAPSTGTPGGLAGKIGLGGTVEEARKAQQEAENKRYNELNASVTNKQKLEANAAIQARDTIVRTTLATNSEHIKKKTEKDNLLNVDTQMPTNQEWINVKDDHKAATDELNRLTTTGGSAKEIVEAKRIVAAAERTKKAKEKELQEELKKKYAGEIAEIDDQMKRIKTEIEKNVETTMMTPEERAKINIVNKARNYAESVRKGRVGSLSYIQKQARRNQLADNMENQRQS